MARQRVKSKPVKQTAQTTLIVNASLYGRKNDRIEKIEIQPFVTEPAYVRASAGVTRNLGEYESLRVDVSITVPCYPEEIDQVYTNLTDKVCELLDEEVSRYIEGGPEVEEEEPQIRPKRTPTRRG